MQTLFDHVTCDALLRTLLHTLWLAFPAYESQFRRPVGGGLCHWLDTLLDVTSHSIRLDSSWGRPRLYTYSYIRAAHIHISRMSGILRFRWRCKIKGNVQREHFPDLVPVFIGEASADGHSVTVAYPS